MAGWAAQRVGVATSLTNDSDTSSFTGADPGRPSAAAIDAAAAHHFYLFWSRGCACIRDDARVYRSAQSLGRMLRPLTPVPIGTFCVSPARRDSRPPAHSVPVFSFSHLPPAPLSLSPPPSLSPSPPPCLYPRDLLHSSSSPLSPFIYELCPHESSTLIQSLP